MAKKKEDVEKNKQNVTKESPSDLGLIQEVNQEYRVSYQTFLVKFRFDITFCCFEAIAVFFEGSTNTNELNYIEFRID